MSDQMHTYEQTLAKINDNHASTVRRTRYNPWLVGLYAAAAFAMPVGAFAIGWEIGYGFGGGDPWQWVGAVVAVLVILPTSGVVLWWANDARAVEHRRMLTERELYEYGPVLPEPPVVSTGGSAPAPDPLRPGIVQGGKVVARAPELSREKAFLKLACLALCRAGKERGSYSRSALAEGPDAMLSGEEWDAASPWLQEQGYFMVKAGRGGGLMPVPGKDIDETIKLLEVAQ